jgi:hypothetical protein
MYTTELMMHLPMAGSKSMANATDGIPTLLKNLSSSGIPSNITIVEHDEKAIQMITTYTVLYMFCWLVWIIAAMILNLYFSKENESDKMKDEASQKKDPDEKDPDEIVSITNTKNPYFLPSFVRHTMNHHKPIMHRSRMMKDI